MNRSPSRQYKDPSSQERKAIAMTFTNEEMAKISKLAAGKLPGRWCKEKILAILAET